MNLHQPAPRGFDLPFRRFYASSAGEEHLFLRAQLLGWVTELLSVQWPIHSGMIGVNDVDAMPPCLDLIVRSSSLRAVNAEPRMKCADMAHHGPV